MYSGPHPVGSQRDPPGCLITVIYIRVIIYLGFPGGTIKSPHANARDVRNVGSIPGSGKFPGEGHG